MPSETLARTSLFRCSGKHAFAVHRRCLPRRRPTGGQTTLRSRSLPTRTHGGGVGGAASNRPVEFVGRDTLLTQKRRDAARMAVKPLQTKRPETGLRRTIRDLW
jgi:hypothetical protein